MPDKSNHLFRDERTERAIVLQLLRDDHEQEWSRAELERKLRDLNPDVIVSSLAKLSSVDVVVFKGEAIQASPCAWCLDALQLLAV